MLFKKIRFDIIRLYSIESLKKGEKSMNSEILEFLERVTDEEKEILAGKKTLKKDIYTNGKEFVTVEADKLLKFGKLISVRTHTRFIDFIEHKHDYVEAIYVLKGSITNIINGEELRLVKGDLLFLNCHASHGIKACGKNDIAVNFIIKPNFFDETLLMLEEKNYISNFLVDTLRNDNTRLQFFLLKSEGIIPIENILENLIYSVISNKSLDERNINKKLMGLLFMYLSHYAFVLEKNSKVNYEEMMVKIIENYIETTYKTATLYEISRQLNSSIFQISRFIKSKFGQNFKELLQEKRFKIAERLLKETDLSVSDIINNIGYENNSYFHKKFREIYGVSPANYRKNKIKNK